MFISPEPDLWTVSKHNKKEKAISKPIIKRCSKRGVIIKSGFNMLTLLKGNLINKSSMLINMLELLKRKRLRKDHRKVIKKNNIKRLLDQLTNLIQD
jgi:hypothetical protein